MTHEIPQEVIDGVRAALVAEFRRQAEISYSGGYASKDGDVLDMYVAMEDVAKAAIQAAIEYGYVVVNQWLPIDACPKDESWFFGLIDGIPYKMKAFMNGDKVNYCWCMHTNISEGQILRIENDECGNERRVQIKAAEEAIYEPNVLAYKAGMNHIPTQWMPYPPTKGDN